MSAQNARVALVTGATSGIGLVTAAELARLGFRVLIACRPSERASAALERLRTAGAIPIEMLPLDLGDFDSIRDCAQSFLAREFPLHLLVNNAGLAGARGLTRSGFELAFGTNHVGHFLLTRLLADRIRQSAPARIVTVASTAHYRAPGIDWEAVRKPTRGLTAMPEYSVSKLANVLFSAELGRRLAGTGITTYSLHPGVVATDIWRALPWPLRQIIKLAMISSERGAATTLFCATSDAVAGQTGLYYDECRVKAPSRPAQDAALAAQLWERSEAWVG